jgi:phosphoketolase
MPTQPKVPAATALSQEELHGIDAYWRASNARVRSRLPSPQILATAILRLS